MAPPIPYKVINQTNHKSNKLLQTLNHKKGKSSCCIYLSNCACILASLSFLWVERGVALVEWWWLMGWVGLMGLLNGSMVGETDPSAVQLSYQWARCVDLLRDFHTQLAPTLFPNQSYAHCTAPVFGTGGENWKGLILFHTWLDLMFRTQDKAFNLPSTLHRFEWRNLQWCLKVAGESFI